MEKSEKYYIYLGDGSFRSATDEEIKEYTGLNKVNKIKFIYNHGNIKIINIAEVDAMRLITLYNKKVKFETLTQFEKFMKIGAIGLIIGVLIIVFQNMSLSSKIGTVNEDLEQCIKKVEKIKK